MNKEDSDNLIFRSAPLGIAEIDIHSGRFTQLNDEYCHILNQPKESLIGQPRVNFIPAGDLPELYSISQKGFSCSRQYRLFTESPLLVTETLIARNNEQNKGSYISILQRNPSQIPKNENRLFTKNIKMVRNALIQSLVTLARFRDRETGDHLLRTKSYVSLLLELSSEKLPLSKYGIELVSMVSMLHDIGKVGIPDSLLLKKGLFTPDEFAIMKTHTTLGAQAIQNSLRYTEYDVSMLFARDIIQYHHERWDGTGYPCGLKAEKIPFLARIMAVADVYDALRSERPYKSAFSHEKAVSIISNESGSHFDPDIVRIFLEKEKYFNMLSVITMEEQA